MKSKGLVMLVVALIAGLAAVVFASRWMQAQAPTNGQIAVALVDVELGAKLAPEMIKMVTWPTDNIPPGAFSTSEQLSGRVVKTSLTRGEPILEGKLAPVGTKGGLSAVVAEGKRAMTVRVNDVVGVAGFALPGNYVDIMVNTQKGEQSDKNSALSKVILERILVLAVAQEASRDETKPKVVNAVTLEVTPEQAENLDVARNVGTLSLVLRNQVDTTDVATKGGTKLSMLNETGFVPAAPVVVKAAAPVKRKVKPATPTPAPAPAKTECLEIIRGIEKTVTCF